MNWSTVKYNDKIDYSAFFCNEPILNEYLHKQAVQDQKNDICTLYFLLNEKKEVGGFYCVCSGSIRRQQLPSAKARKNLPGYPLGTFHIGRLARHKDIVNQKLGDRLIFSVFELAVKSAEATAALAVTVDAKNLHAETYYAKYGFKKLNTDPEKADEYPKAMYLKMKDVRFILSVN